MKKKLIIPKFKNRDQEFEFWLQFQRRVQKLKYTEGKALPSLESLSDLE